MTKTIHRKVNVADLTVDPRPGLQRVEGLDRRRVARMAADFRPHALGSITVSERADGTLVVLDGMHRAEVCRSVGHDKVPAHVYTGLTVAQEAELFHLLNQTKQPSAISRFLARVTLGDQAAVEMSEILAAHGWRVGTAPEPGNLASVEAMERVYRSASGALPKGTHPEILDQTITILTAAWEHDTTSVQGAMLEGVAQVLGRFGSQADVEKLVAEMSDTRPAVLIGKAKALRDVQGGTVPGALAKILVNAHNKRRRTNLLPEWVWVR